MQGTSFRFSRFVVRPVVLLVLAFPAAAILFGPSPRVTSQNLDIAQKPQRPQFVPGEALVRFKSGHAFEGTMSVTVPNGDPLFSQDSRSSQSIEITPEQVAVTLNRFDGSAIVDGLRIARMAPDDTAKAIAALRLRDDVLYAEPNYLRRAIATPNDQCFPPNSSSPCSSSLGLYGLNKIGAPQAWDTNTGSSSVVVGVIDEA